LAGSFDAVAPKACAGDGGGEEKAYIVEEKAVRVTGTGTVVKMGEDVNDEHAPVGEQERRIYEYH
jgi:hypothetical protein